MSVLRCSSQLLTTARPTMRLFIILPLMTSSLAPVVLSCMTKTITIRDRQSSPLSFIHQDALVRYIQDSHWSSSYITALSLVESDATPALLCHKEPACRIQNPLLGALDRKIPLEGYFACSSLVLYGIRELAPATL